MLPHERFLKGVGLAVLAAPVFAVMAAVMVCAEAGVVWLLWRWFIVPLGLPTISLAHVVGLDVVVSLMTWRYTPPPTDANDYMKKKWTGLAMALAIGFIASRFM